MCKSVVIRRAVNLFNEQVSVHQIRHLGNQQKCYNAEINAMGDKKGKFSFKTDHFLDLKYSASVQILGSC